MALDCFSSLHRQLVAQRVDSVLISKHDLALMMNDFASPVHGRDK